MSASLREQFDEAAMHVSQVGNIDTAITSGMRRRNRTFAVATAAGVTCVAILAGVLWAAGPSDSQREPLQPPTPTPTPFPQSVVHGWPDTTRNAPGVYSLDGSSCGWRRPHSCNIGFMHNGYGSGDVEVRINAGSEVVISEDGGTSVSIAGHDGMYRRITARQEDWTFDVDGTPVAINLAAAPGTSQADLAEAHAVIDSMYTQPSDNAVGFRLVFTLTSNDWDSG